MLSKLREIVEVYNILISYVNVEIGVFVDEIYYLVDKISVDFIVIGIYG